MIGVNEVNFVDTTCRDAHQSLWGIGMTTDMVLPVAEAMDQAGFAAIDINAPAHFKRFIRDLQDDPWERIRLVSQRIKSTPLAVSQVCTITGFGVTPLSLLKLWMERLAANGIRRLFLMESSNDMTLRVPDMVRFAKEAGIKVTMSLIYSLSPKHTDEYYAQKTRDAVKLKVDSLYLKDPGGLLTPDRIRTIVPVIMQNANGLPIEIHSHCTTGLAPLCYLEAIKLGVETIHTAIPPLANSSSLPSVLNMADNLRRIGYTPTIDPAIIKDISNHFTLVAKREQFPMGEPLEYDHYQYIHQVPGGVISNLKRQLVQLRIEHRLDEVLEESIRVRKDLGYPIMVTPFSQYVVSQAALNVISGERYSVVTDEIMNYALGQWGKEASSAVDPDLRDKIMSNPRAKDLTGLETPEPSLEEVRQKIGGPGVSDDDLLLRFIMGGEEEIKAMRATGRVRKYYSAETPLLTLFQELEKQKDLNYIRVQKGASSFTLKR